MTPTNVAQVQTKRTQRRSASVSSQGTATGDVYGRPSLHRRASSSSMTERTFRSPSPGARRGSVSDDRLLDQEDAPPVPPLPKHVDTRAVKADKHRKTQSMSNPPFRVASEKLQEEGTPSWYTGAHVGDLSNVRTSDAAMTSPPLSPPPRFNYEEEERPDSRNSSINFSYPSRLRVGSPAPSPTAGQFESSVAPATQKRSSSVSSSMKDRRPASTTAVESLVYDPNSRRMVPRVMYVPEQDSERSMRNKQKKSKPIPKTGLHLSQGTMGRTKTAPEAAAYAAVGHATQERPVERVQAEPPRREAHKRERIPEPRHEEVYEAPPVRVKGRSSREVSRERAAEETHRVPVTIPTALIQHEELEMEEEPAVKTLVTSPRYEQQQAAVSPPTVELPETEDSVVRDRQIREGLRRQPSVVHEEPEPESDEEQQLSPADQTVSSALNDVPTRQKVYGTDLQEAKPAPITVPAPVVKPRAVSLQPPVSNRVTRERSNSNGSPARTARFGGVTGNLSVRHSPPARSVSPRKSALKQSVSPSRGASPDNMSEASSSGLNRQDEGSVQRKKSVRVSFDEENNVVLGESPSQAPGSSPTASSPQSSGRRPWYSNIGRSKKQDVAPLDDDEIMQPRPVLPSFGSVRDKKPKDSAPVQEGRPLVRPMADAHHSPSPNATPSLPASPDVLPAVTQVSGELEHETREISAGTGGDYSVPVSQAETDNARIAANTSRFREPLPPVVTSIEGNGYVSDSTTSEEEEHTGAPLAQTATNASENERFSTPEPELPVHKEEAASANILAADHPNVPIQDTISPRSEEAVVAQEQEKPAEHHIPTISISQPTPQALSPSTRHYFFHGVPGGFPEDDSPVGSPQELDVNPIGAVPETALAHSKEEDGLAREDTFEPVSQASDAVQTSHTPATVPLTLVPVAEEEDDTGSSIYSDAPDHFTDSDDEGFLSLNAVVDRPVGQKSRKQDASKAVDDHEPFPPFPAHLSTATTVVESPTGEPAPYDWDKAKAYWRSLTAERRAQLEKEAVDDAGTEGDMESPSEGTTKGKKKKSVERRTSERQALAVHMAQQMMLEQQQKEKQQQAEAPAATKTRTQPKQARDPERTYQIKPGTKLGENRTTPLSPLNAGPDKVSVPSNKASESVPKIRKSMRTNGAAPSRGTAPEQQTKRSSGMAGRTLRSGGAVSPEPQQSGRPSGMAAKTLRSGGGPQTQNDRAPRRVSSPPLPTSAANTAIYTAMNSGRPAAQSLRRRDSTDSDSSFRRARQEPSQGFGFRKTLRQPSQSPAPVSREPAPAPRPASSRFSLRSLSPTGSRSHFDHGSPQSGMGMRSSLRGSSVKESKPSGGGLFGRSSAKPAKASSRSSRFGDSSDEDEKPRKGGFRSRFDDSSDEDEVRPLPSLSQGGGGLGSKTMRTMRSDKTAEAGYGSVAKPAAVRRYPSALAEEEEEESDGDPYVDHEKHTTPPPAQPTTTGPPEMMNSPLMPPTRPAINEGAKSPSSRRGSFMSVLRRKKNPKKSEGIARPERIDSAARRDTNLERTPAELEQIRRSGDFDVPASRPTSPRRLSKRTNSMPLDAALASPGVDWPLTIRDGTQERPGTAGNLGTRTMSKGDVRPGQRRSMSANLLDGGMGVNGGQGGVEGQKKKKKFGALRKMFGLDD